MTYSACPEAFESYYTPACYSSGPYQAWQLDASPAPAVVTTWHMVPLSPTATGLVLVLLSILFATLLVSRPQK